MLRNLREVFLALTMVVVIDTRLVIAVILFHDGTLNSSVATKVYGSRRTARGFELRSEKAAITFSGWAMFPPRAVTWCKICISFVISLIERNISEDYFLMLEIHSSTVMVSILRFNTASKFLL